ncbi:hypothetical protein GOODEAATRI_014723 [Goodea atripinnis]|uniref:Uncharacterized protein n=1 Tax=Goodea atripinnis TaxID=208336 RepID=A0ABV0P450_9TELE
MANLHKGKPAGRGCCSQNIVSWPGSTVETATILNPVHVTRPTGSSISNDSSLSTGGRTTMVAPRQALPGRMLIQADHRHPGRPITESVSLTKMPKIPTLLNEAEPLKDLALTLAVSW